MHIEAGSTTIERRLIQDAAQKRIPINGSIELLPLCNMRCDMCYVRMDRQEMESKGRLRTAEEWLEVARQMRDALPRTRSADTFFYIRHRPLTRARRGIRRPGWQEKND